MQRQLDVESDQIRKLALIQRRIDAERRLAESSDPIDMEALESGFVKAARSYSDRRGISYKAWREMGVAAAVLGKSG
ncbi:MAG: hypothetical protein OXI06_01235, partial [bacterium]|nr:hypothetical protein [bacterium]